MRAPIFVRFREDKKPEECIIESARDTRKVLGQIPDKQAAPKVAFSNLDKVFWPAISAAGRLTKGDLIEFYNSISSYILPHLRDRPLSLSRYPDGILGKSFYHKNWEHTKPYFVKTIKVFSESRGDVINYILCENRETLLWLANLGCIEMHPWYSRVRDFSACLKDARRSKAAESVLDHHKCGLGTPDFIVFDLDPYIYSGKEKGTEPEYNFKGFTAAVDVAVELKNFLHQLKIRSYVKTSGKTGLHIFVPISPIHSYDQTRAFARTVGKILVNRSPSKITMEWDTAKRKGKVFFDYNQNAKGKTIASIFSVRPTRSATVSMPLNWDEISSVRPTDFMMKNVAQTLQSRKDPWERILNENQDIANILSQVSELA
jgi:bifunctional non-homologous end joining protein LigD